jgi:hypothetical protein
MKKFITLGLILVALSVTASAQQGPGERFRRHHRHEGFRHGEITRHERMGLRKNEFRYGMAQHRARRDGVVTPFEQRRPRHLRRHDRFEAFRYRHNDRRRVI